MIHDSSIPRLPDEVAHPVYVADLLPLDESALLITVFTDGNFGYPIAQRVCIIKLQREDRFPRVVNIAMQISEADQRQPVAKIVGLVKLRRGDEFACPVYVAVKSVLALARRNQSFRPFPRIEKRFGLEEVLSGFVNEANAPASADDRQLSGKRRS